MVACAGCAVAGKTLIRLPATPYEMQVLGRPVWWSDRIVTIVKRSNRRKPK